MKKRFIVWMTAFLMVFMLIPVSGFAADKDHKLAPEYDYDSLTVGTVTEFSGNFFSPLFGNNGSDLDVQQLLHDYRPVEWNNTKGCYETNPYVVSNLLITDKDSVRTYSVFLCNDLYFSDGSSITAEDYVFSLLLSADPLVGNIGGDCKDLSCIPGMKDWQDGKDDSVISGIRILNDYAFSVSVSKDYLPNFYELKILDFTPFPMNELLPKCEFLDDGKGVYLSDPLNIHTERNLKKLLLDSASGYVSHPKVVSGPYVQELYSARTVRFKINKYYKCNINGKKPTIETITYTVVRNKEAISLLEEGKIGLLHKATEADTITDGIALVQGGEYRMTAYPRSGGSFISFSCERIATGEKAVRQAIAYCLDKDLLIKEYVGQYGKRVDGYYGIGQWMYGMVSGDMETELDVSSLKAEMQNVRVYTQDISKAVSTLEDAGWNLNEKGEAFTVNDKIRYKAFESSELESKGLLKAAKDQGGKFVKLNGKECVLIPLSLRLCCPSYNKISDYMKAALVEPLAQAGIQLKVDSKPYKDMLKQYYREKEREYDLMFLGTNFNTGFDPATTFSTEEKYQNSNNCTGIQDAELEKAAKDLNATQSGDVLGYCTKWVKLQKAFQEAVPSMFIYSNMYADFYTYALNNYNIKPNITWTKAIVEAYMSDPVEDANPSEASKLYVGN